MDRNYFFSQTESKFKKKFMITCMSPIIVTDIYMTPDLGPRPRGKREGGKGEEGRGKRSPDPGEMSETSTEPGARAVPSGSRERHGASERHGGLRV